METAQRRVLVQYPKRQMAGGQSGGEASHMPLKINMAGVIPPIFASSLLLVPASIANFSPNAEWAQLIGGLFSPGKPLYTGLYVALIVFFCFFYTALQFNPDETADNLKSNGGFIPGVRPGKSTSKYFDYVMTRLTVVGAAYISLVCILPELVNSQFSVPFYFGGTSLLIVVSVTMDLVTRIQTHLIAQKYESLLKKTQFKRKKRVRA
jgi:preprotein translocase subunit SecY